MSSAKYIGRVGALAAALGIGNVRRAATRMTVSIGVAALVVMATAVPAPVSTVSPAVKLSADSTALIMGATSIPTPDDFYVESVKSQFIAPTHPGQDIKYVAVTTPEEMGPLTGLFDLTWDQSVQAGVADLETAMTKYGNDDLVIYGRSQGAAVASLEMRKLAEQYPAGTTAPDIDFVLGGDGNLPNGGFLARFPGLYIPILDISFTGPEPTDTQFDTAVITRQYDAFADFPLYPINVIADLNAVLGFFYVHLYAFDVSLAPDPSTSTPFQDAHGDTSYYFFETQDLPLFDPLRTLGVPEPLIDVFEPFFRVIVELGYDRSIPPWEPTPARLIPPLNPATVAADLVNAIGEGFNNALALFGLPPLLSIPAAPNAVSGKAAVEQNPADDLDTAVEQNPADNLDTAVEQNPADNLDTAVEQNPADNLKGNPAHDIDRNQQTTLTGTHQTTSTETRQMTSTGPSNGTRQTTSTGTSSGTHKTASTGTSTGTRQTVRGDADRPSTHSAADDSPVQHAAPSADRRRVHPGAADAPNRAAGLQGTDTT